MHPSPQLLLITLLVLSHPLEVSDSSPSRPEGFALLDLDGCYKLKRDLGLEGVYIPRLDVSIMDFGWLTA